MSDGVKPRRPYRSPRRTEQARATRRSVLDAAAALFIAHGYAATSIGAIARRAGVSAETIYATVGSKPALLAELVDVAIAGGPDAPAIIDQPWVGELRSEPDTRSRLRLLARHGAAILERRWELDSVVQAAASADATLTDLADRLRRERHEGQRRLLELALGDEARARIDHAAAVDTLYALGSPETYRLLVRDRGWSKERFAAWYADALERLLLP